MSQGPSRRIAEYIAANRRRFTREAIRQQLIDAGYAPEDIDATWAVLDTPDPDSTAGEGFWGRFWLMLLGINVAVFLLVTVPTGMLGGVAGAGSVIAVILGVALAIGALIAWGVVAATGPAKLGRRSALVIGAVVPLIFALLIGGSCYALVGSMGGFQAPPPARSGVIELQVDAPVAFDASGPAGCQSYEGGFNVFSDQLATTDGRLLNVSVDAFQSGPGAESLTPNIFIALLGGARDGQPESAYTGGHPETSLDLDATPDGLSGTLRFDGLVPESLEGQGVPPDAPESELLSGTVSWQCE